MSPKVLIGTEKDYQDIIINAKKEVFDDIEDSELFREHISQTDWYKELKEKHLGENDPE